MGMHQGMTPFKFPCKNLQTDYLLGLGGKACGKAVRLRNAAAW